jgi:hypothetical protein
MNIFSGEEAKQYSICKGKEGRGCLGCKNKEYDTELLRPVSDGTKSGSLNNKLEVRHKDYVHLTRSEVHIFLSITIQVFNENFSKYQM